MELCRLKFAAVAGLLVNNLIERGPVNETVESLVTVPLEEDRCVKSRVASEPDSMNNVALLAEATIAKINIEANSFIKIPPLP
jgi:hypothetical protein